MDTDSPIFNETFCRMPTLQLFTTLGPSRITSQVGSRRIRWALLSGYILLLQNLFWTTQWWKAWPHYKYCLNIFCSFKIYVGTYLYLLFPILYFQNTSTQTLHIGPLKFRRSVNRNVPQSCPEVENSKAHGIGHWNWTLDYPPWESSEKHQKAY